MTELKSVIKAAVVNHLREHYRPLDIKVTFAAGGVIRVEGRSGSSWVSFYRDPELAALFS